jgi:hypothetical protein
MDPGDMEYEMAVEENQDLLAHRRWRSRWEKDTLMDGPIVQREYSFS